MRFHSCAGAAVHMVTASFSTPAGASVLSTVSLFVLVNLILQLNMGHGCLHWHEASLMHLLPNIDANAEYMKLLHVIKIS